MRVKLGAVSGRGAGVWVSGLLAVLFAGSADSHPVRAGSAADAARTVPPRVARAVPTPHPAIRPAPATSSPGSSLPVMSPSNPLTVTQTATQTVTPPGSLPARPPALTGFGATDADWRSRHLPDPARPAGTAYNPDPLIPAVDGKMGARYFDVVHTAGRVLGYTVAIDPGSGLAGARRTALAELPGDAREVWSAPLGSCSLVQLRSATLARVLGNLDPTGSVLVELRPATGAYAVADDIAAAVFRPLWIATPSASTSCQAGGAG
ncbi:MAG: hypothetical protein HYR62_09930 [Actinobacteria bacterium]|nr:hypothetical protein [Actinomycetota bacterium]MBI3686432.1 hypothetical protein [Actinomycetota bacterium]